jgi:hypothetical protein
MTENIAVFGHAIISDETRQDVHLKLIRENDCFRWYTEDGIGTEEEGRTVGEAWNALLHDSYHAQWQLRFIDAED